MDFGQVITQVIGDSQQSLWPAVGSGFKPEIVLCITLFVLLIAKCFTWGTRIDLAFPLTCIGLCLSLYVAEPWNYLSDSAPPRTELFTGMLVLDSFTAFFRAILLLSALLLVILTQITGVPDLSDATDFFCLVLGAIVGLCLMASANHALMIFLAVEIASIPSYVLAGLLKNQRRSSEAALKYSIYGAGAAGVMLYGISLLTGVLNTAHLPSMAQELATQWPVYEADTRWVLVMGGLMLGVGLAFKLSAVPFHFWCPDVFEGSAAEIGAFLSVASKAGALALLVRVSFGFGLLTVEPMRPSADTNSHVGMFSVTDKVSSDVPSNSPTESDSLDLAELNHRLAPTRNFIICLISLVAMITCTFGNLAAYGQTNIKRLLAYSTIAHAGYMMMAVPPALAMATSDASGARYAIAALGMYILTYVFMNLGVFSVVALLRNSLGSEEIADYAGLIRNAPLTVICFALMMFSLLGIPPLAGFIGKFAVFGALTDGWRSTGSPLLLGLLVVGGLNTALSVFYYLRVIKVMTFDREIDSTRPRPLSVISPLGACYVFAISVPLLAITVMAAPLHEWSLAAALQLF